MSVRKFAIPIMLVLALALAACTPGTTGGELPDTGETATAETSPEASPEVSLPTATQETPTAAAPTATPVTPTATAPAATQTPQAVEVETSAELEAALQAAGAEVEQAGAIDEPIFPVEAQNLSVDGEQVQVFEFADEAARQAAADTIEANGFIIGTMAVDWIGQPNFWSQGRLIVLYVGEDEATIRLISDLMGDPITGPQQPGGGLPPAAAIAAQQWLAGELGITEADIPVVMTEQVDWPDACLGLPQPEEVCAQVITPGWRVTLRVGDQEFEVRTNLDGTVIRRPAG